MNEAKRLMERRIKRSEAGKKAPSLWLLILPAGRRASSWLIQPQLNRESAVPAECTTTVHIHVYIDGLVRAGSNAPNYPLKTTNAGESACVDRVNVHKAGGKHREATSDRDTILNHCP